VSLTSFTKDDAVVHHKDEHISHIPNAAEIGAKKLIQKVKETATSQIEATPHQVVSQIPSLSEAICATLPSVPAMKKIVQRIRRLIKCSPHQILQLYQN